MTDLPIKRINLSVEAGALRPGDVIFSAPTGRVITPVTGSNPDFTIRDAHVTGHEVFVYLADNETPLANILLADTDTVRIRRVVGTREVEEPVRPPLNGGELIGAFRRDRGYVVLVKLGDNAPQQYVTAYADSLEAPSWGLGHYFDDPNLAQVDFLQRADLRWYEQS